MLRAILGPTPGSSVSVSTLGGISESYRSTQIAAAAFRYPALRWWNPTGVMSASSCSTDVPAIFSGVHPNATSRAVAACVIGGTSLRGGRGTVPGVLFGALVMSTLLNGMTLMALSPELKLIARGVVLTLAVWLDSRLGNR